MNNVSRPRGLLCLIAAAAGLSGACLPPPPVGYVSLGPHPKGTVLWSAQAGGGAPAQRVDRPTGVVGGTLQVEPFATTRLSVPVTLGVARLLGDGGWVRFNDSDSRGILSGSARVGLRYRIGARDALGLGLGGQLERWEVRTYEDPGYRTTRETMGGATIDAEYSTGYRWRRIGLSWSSRILFRIPFAIHLLSDLTLAWYPKSETFAMTFSAFVGVSATNVWTGGSVGLLIRP